MRSLRLASLVSFLLLCLAGPVSARGGMPDPLTPRGELIEGLYYKLFLLALGVFLLVVALLVYVMVRYRAGSGHGRATFEMERENLKLELTWIIIPLFIVLWVGFIAYAGLVQLDEGIDAEDTEMEVHIIGQKWFWSAQYDDFKVDSFYDATGNVNEGNEFYFPADTPITLNVTGADVIHAFHIMDANWATVALTDANPGGPHQYNKITLELPEGEYRVQCREMCFNPGHGYMRAKIIVVPEAEYQAWYDATVQKINEPKLAFAIEVDDAGITDTPLKTAPGSAVRLQFANARATDITFTASSGESVTVASNAVGFLDVLPEAVGRIDITSDQGDSLALDVVEPQVIKVTLGDFYISPTDFTMQAGELYRIEVTNEGGTPHNLFIGDYEGPDVKTTLWNSETINSGQTTGFLALPSAATQFDTWCDVPGHAQSGMLASASAQ